MKKSKSTKRALFSSVIAILVCFAMLIGATFAWFTDSVTSGKNTIVAGNLDVELEYLNNGKWKTVEGATDLFKQNTLWEPGHTEVVYLRIRNAGTLALKYRFSMNIVSETTATNVAGEDFKLSEHLKYGIVESDTVYEDRDAARNAVTNALPLADYSEEENIEAGADPRCLALVVYMPETVGNEANYRGDVIPTIELGLNLVATQYTSEADSFGNTYDANATYDTNVTSLNTDAEGNFLIGTADELVFFAEAINTNMPGYADANKTFKLTADIDLADKNWIPVGQTGGYSAATWFKGTFDGQGHTIKNLTIGESKWEAGANEGKNFATGFLGFVDIPGATVKNVTFDNAKVAGHHWVGVVAGYMTGTVSNVTVTNSTVTSSYKTPEADGDKAGAVVGYLNSGTVNGCSVENATITAVRDCGGVVGMSCGTVTGNTVKDSFVYYSTDNEAQIGGAIAGKRANGVDDTNTATNVTVSKMVVHS